MQYIAILAVCLIFLASLAFMMQLGLKQILHAIFYQIYYYFLGSSAMFEDFIYRRSNKTALQKLTGRVAVVSGGARGLGVEVVRSLMQCDIHVVIGCRNLEAGKRTVQEIQDSGVKTGSAEVLPLDLMSLKSVKLFAEKVLQKYTGIMFVPFKLTEDSLESHFAVNYLGHCFLTHLLLPHLKLGAEASRKNSRIVNVSSCAYLAGKINFEDLTMMKGYIPQAAYAQSKLAQILFTIKLNKLLEKSGIPVQVHSVHPGIVNTDLFNGTSLKRVAPFIPALMFKTPSQGASSVVHAAISEELEGTGGNYISNCHISKLKYPATDVEVQDKLWMIMLRLARIEKFGGI
ncbi:WW domain-containing oxidoreductase [Gryllus bimaculatus]|nr:WW domain-containing oxidoreductase [Gryllus bimaculatus]